LRKQASRSSAARRTYRQALENAWITSSKIDKALEIVEQIQNDGTGDKIIIFSQFTSLLDLMEIPLRRRGWLFRRYDGSMRLADRHAVVVEFSTNPNCRLMLVSLRAGNAGLNLTAASKVIILDPFWNPFVEEQAIGRVHRIGQQRPVHVYRILIPDTVEDRIQNLQDEKRRLVQGTLSDAADAAVRLGRQNLTYLLVGPTSVARNPV
jgi:SNF2 family DNA or RNA helicase